MARAIVVRAEHLDDRDVIWAVVRAAFRSELEADLVDAIRASPEYIPELALVAQVDGDPRYYGRLGFEPSAPYGIHIDLSGWAPPEAAQIRLLAGRPSVSGRVVYPPAFDAVTDH